MDDANLVQRLKAAALELVTEAEASYSHGEGVADRTMSGVHIVPTTLPWVTLRFRCVFPVPITDICGMLVEQGYQAIYTDVGLRVNVSR